MIGRGVSESTVFHGSPVFLGTFPLGFAAWAGRDEMNALLASSRIPPAPLVGVALLAVEMVW
jgi:hypothetical protein